MSSSNKTIGDGGCIPSPNDVLCGRGGEIHSHAGNRRYRMWVQDRREAYSLSDKKEKKNIIAREVVDLVKNLNPPGKFLRKNNKDSSQWAEIAEEKALHKTSQALREGAPAIRAKANQKREVLKKVCILPQPMKVAQPFMPFYHHYGNFPRPIFATPTLTDSTLHGRLGKAETMFEHLVQNQVRTQQAIQLSTFYKSCEFQMFQAPSILDASKLALMHEIELLRREVSTIGQSSCQKHALNECKTRPNKKAKIKCDSVLSYGLLQP